MFGSSGCGVEQAAWKREPVEHAPAGLWPVPAASARRQQQMDSMFCGGVEDAEHGVPYEKGEEITDTELRAMWQLGWQGAKEQTETPCPKCGRTGGHWDDCPVPYIPTPDGHLGGVRD